MARRWLIGPAVVVGIALVGTGIWWFNRPEPIPTRPPASAPPVGSCWRVDAAGARAALPWSGAPVGCATEHTAEIFHVGQVDHELIGKARSARGSEVTLANNLMYAQARRACEAFASTYLGGDWHKDQVTVVANWVSPAGDGFFGCALAQVADPAGTSLVSRTSSLKATGDSGGLAIECVRRGTGETLGYSRCDQEHDGEFVGTYTLTPPDAPFDANAVKDTATKGCGQVALGYLGLPITGNRADLQVGYVGPTTASTWLGSDQTFACYAMAGVKLRGSIHSLGTRTLPH
jgi:hypothetical protein